MIRTDVATPVAAPNHVVAISPSNTLRVTTLDDDDYTFRTTASDAIQARCLANWRECGYKTAAILYINDPYGGGLAEHHEWFENSGGKVLGVACDPERSLTECSLCRLAKGDPMYFNRFIRKAA